MITPAKWTFNYEEGACTGYQTLNVRSQKFIILQKIKVITKHTKWCLLQEENLYVAIK